MNVAYLLEDTTISAIARLTMAHADALIVRGHRVRIVTKGTPVTWRSSRAEWVYVDDFREYDDREDEYAGPAPENLLVDEEVYRAVTPSENEPLRVLLSGAAQVEHKGIEEGYGAVAHARWFHQKLDLVRVSPWAPSREEPLDAVQEFHVALTTAEMARLLHTCDLFLGPGHAEESFGLAAAEAMASGIPCVLTSIPAHLAFDETPDYALFAPEQNAVEFGEKLIELMSDGDLRERLRMRGREVAEKWRA